MSRVYFPAIAAAFLAACSPAPVDTTPVPLTPPGVSANEATGPAVVRRAVPEPPEIALPPSPPAPPPTAAAALGVVIPPDALYVCVSDKDGMRQTTAIEFAPKVGALCAKNPEMGPCQYERSICRNSGGRVYAANGAEITMQTEAEYDKKVMRVKLKSN
ncbi:MAG: hypothetical protein ABI607_03835 [Betaproteobacteria bacterium]